MQRLLGSLGALGAIAMLVLACTETTEPVFFGNPDAGGLAGLGGLGGSSGSSSGGRGGAAGAAGGAVGQGGSAGAPDNNPDAGGNVGCNADAECDDQNACTLDSCAGGVCVTGELVAAGTPCGSNTDSECSNADTCDAQGVCQPNDEASGVPCGSNFTDECTEPDTCDGSGQCAPNDAEPGTFCGSTNDDECANPDVCSSGLCLANDEPNGTACTDGSCTLSVCVAGQAVGCPVEVAADVPFVVPWSSVGRPDLYGSECDDPDMPDYALVFTAPATATFRFSATARVDDTPHTGAGQVPDGDAVMTVTEGGCAGAGAEQVACNDDAAQGTLDAQLDLPLTSGQVVTVYLNELTQSGGGTGTLTITQLP